MPEEVGDRSGSDPDVPERPNRHDASMSEASAPPGATSVHSSAQPPTDTSWHFVRSANGRIGGVCESTAVATGLDVGLVRLATIGAALWGPGLIAYLALMVAVPRADHPADPRIRPAPPHIAKWIRVALAVGGGLGAATLLGGISWANWPIGAFYRDGGAIGVTLLAIAIAVIVLRRRESPPSTPSSTLPPPTSPPTPPPPPGPSTPPAPSADPAAPGPGGVRSRRAGCRGVQSHDTGRHDARPGCA